MNIKKLLHSKLFAIGTLVSLLAVLPFVQFFSGGIFPIALTILYVVIADMFFLFLFCATIFTDWHKTTSPENLSQLASTWPGALAFMSVLLFGVVFPALVLFFECTSQMCSQYVVNLIPTNRHLALLILGPAINTLFFWQLFAKQKMPRKILGFFNGVAIGIAVCFSIVMLPIVAVIFVGVIIAMFGGLGWLPLSPFLALFATIKLFDLVSIKLPELRLEKKSRICGLLVGAALFVLVQCPEVVTSHLVDNYVRHPSDQEALERLSYLADREYLLKLCYKRRRIKSLAEQVCPQIEMEDARKTFLKVTGKSYDSYPRPDGALNDDQYWRD